MEYTGSHCAVTINLHYGVQSRSIENVVSGITYYIQITISNPLDFLKVRFCGSPVGRKMDFPHLQRTIFYRPDFRSAACPGVWQQ